MALVLADRVQETTTSTGTGSVTLAGAVTGYQTFAVIGNGNTTFYSSKEFVDFFGPIINELKVRLDNGISNSIQE